MFSLNIVILAGVVGLALGQGNYNWSQLVKCVFDTTNTCRTQFASTNTIVNDCLADNNATPDVFVAAETNVGACLTAAMNSTQCQQPGPIFTAWYNVLSNKIKDQTGVEQQIAQCTFSGLSCLSNCQGQGDVTYSGLMTYYHNLMKCQEDMNKSTDPDVVTASNVMHCLWNDVRSGLEKSKVVKK